MTEKSKQEDDHDFWSHVDSVMQPDGAAGSELEPAGLPSNRRSVSMPSSVPDAIAMQMPDTDAPRGILMNWKKNALDRTSTLKALEAQYNAQLDALRYHLSKAVAVSNARADRIAEEFLKKLDAERIEILKEMGLRNAEVRATALISIREMIFTKVKELRTKQWPESFVDRTLKDLFELEKRACAEMMKELGA